MPTKQDIILAAFDRRRAATTELCLKEALRHEVNLGNCRRNGTTSAAPVYFRFREQCRRLATLYGMELRTHLIVETERDLQLETMAYRVASMALGLSEDEMRAHLQHAIERKMPGNGNVEISILKRSEI